MTLGDPFPFLRFVWVPAELEQKIRSTSTRLGILSVVLGPIFGIMLIPLWGALTFAAILGTACASGVLISGAALMTGRTCVSSCYVNLTIAGQVRRLTLGFWIFTIFFAGISYLPLMAHLNASTDASTGAIITGMLLPIPMLALTTINYVIGRRLFGPSPKLLHEFGASGQIVGPTQFGPPQRWGPPQGPPPQGGPPPPQWGPPPNQ